MRPPSIRTLTTPGSRPLFSSTVSNRVSVQISPFSKQVSTPMHRSRATAVARFASSSKRSRESVVAFAATASNASPARNRIHKNRRRCTKLISIHLQHAARRGLVKICVLYEKRARARRGVRRDLQREMDNPEPRGLFGDYRDVAGPGHRVGHAGVQRALRKNTDVCGRNAARGPLQGNRAAAQRARIARRNEWAQLPATATSAGVTGAVHSRAEVQVVIRAVPPISIVEAGPGLDAAKPLPSTRSVKP